MNLQCWKYSVVGKATRVRIKEVIKWGGREKKVLIILKHFLGMGIIEKPSTDIGRFREKIVDVGIES